VAGQLAQQELVDRPEEALDLAPSARGAFAGADRLHVEVGGDLL
jgi:hypothetical protein